MQQKEAEEKYEATKKRRNELMAQVEEIEIKLERKLQHRRTVMAEIM